MKSARFPSIVPPPDRPQNWEDRINKAKWRARTGLENWLPIHLRASPLRNKSFFTEEDVTLAHDVFNSPVGEKLKLKAMGRWVAWLNCDHVTAKVLADMDVGFTAAVVANDLDKAAQLLEDIQKYPFAIVPK